MVAAGNTKRRRPPCLTPSKSETAIESPEPRRLPGTRPRGTEGLLDPNRQRLATRRRQGLQHPARRRAARRPDHAPRRHRKERLTQPGGPQCPPHHLKGIRPCNTITDYHATHFPHSSNCHRRTFRQAATQDFDASLATTSNASLQELRLTLDHNSRKGIRHETQHHRHPLTTATASAAHRSTCLLFRGPRPGRQPQGLASSSRQPHHCAVLDVDKLALGDIAFGSNSWRGDHYEPHLRAAEADRPPVEPPDTDIHDLLAKRQQIAAIWGIEDVQSIRPDLSEQQAWEVLQMVDRHKDAELGITWLTLEMRRRASLRRRPRNQQRGGVTWAIELASSSSTGPACPQPSTFTGTATPCRPGWTSSRTG